MRLARLIRLEIIGCLVYGLWPYSVYSLMLKSIITNIVKEFLTICTAIANVTNYQLLWTGEDCDLLISDLYRLQGHFWADHSLLIS